MNSLKQSFICPHCKQKIIGKGFAYKNKHYCSYECANIAAESDKIKEKQMAELCQFLRQQFNIPEVPFSVVEQIEKKIDDESGDQITLSGIKKTIEYYINVKGCQTSDIKYVKWIIDTHYQEAKEYYKQQKKILEINKKIDLNIPSVKVKLSKKQLDKKNKIGYNIEDL